MSKIADDVYTTLKELFPHHHIEREYYIYYKNTRLFFDYYIPSMSLLFEIQGIQHAKYIHHFHGSIEAFREQKRRDNLKVEFVQNSFILTLVYFYDTIDNITKELVMQRIYKAQQEAA